MSGDTVVAAAAVETTDSSISFQIFANYLRCDTFLSSRNHRHRETSVRGVTRVRHQWLPLIQIRCSIDTTHRTDTDAQRAMKKTPSVPKSAAGQEIRLRLIINDSPSNVRWWSQHGASELAAPLSITPNTVTFELTVRVIRTDAGAIDFRGPVVQGPRGVRFVYLNSHSSGATLGVPWNRRAKITLQTITDAHLVALASDPTNLLEAQIHGVARDGGPACASVKLLGNGWTLASRHSHSPL